ncbi:hypothetical protein BKG92_07470 [Rodentibacter ratti]|uniref:Phosphoribosyltransferase domain-containing protein n=1 Tax=Rodentibacter ratti TaxID=1906745 RepID=A0A1V3KXU2_9PAST|nr:phosphoribosyltransferase [Rodentibacter ratti]OOF81953.1 hypothetical protein BKG92_07470 [Rodentibacter ratti]
MKFKIKGNEVVIKKIYPNSSISKVDGKVLGGKITIYSVIRRFKERRGAKRPIGDNCPMLYAMKGAEGLTTDADTINKVYEHAQKLIDEYSFEENLPFDVIILMPSKHEIGRNLANLLSQKFDIEIIDNFLKKKEPEKLFDEVKKDHSIPQDAKQALKAALRSDSGTFSIKDVAPKHRKYLHIFNGYNLQLPKGTKHVLLVDDISSSGATFESAVAVIKQHCKQVETISAFTLFAPLK